MGSKTEAATLRVKTASFITVYMRSDDMGGAWNFWQSLFYNLSTFVYARIPAYPKWPEGSIKIESRVDDEIPRLQLGYFWEELEKCGAHVSGKSSLSYDMAQLCHMCGDDLTRTHILGFWGNRVVHSDCQSSSERAFAESKEQFLNFSHRSPDDPPPYSAPLGYKSESKWCDMCARKVSCHHNV